MSKVASIAPTASVFGVAASAESKAGDNVVDMAGKPVKQSEFRSPISAMDMFSHMAPMQQQQQGNSTQDTSPENLARNARVRRTQIAAQMAQLQENLA